MSEEVRCCLAGREQLPYVSFSRPYMAMHWHSLAIPLGDSQTAKQLLVFLATRAWHPRDGDNVRQERLAILDAIPPAAVGSFQPLNLTGPCCDLRQTTRGAKKQPRSPKLTEYYLCFERADGTIYRKDLEKLPADSAPRCAADFASDAMTGILAVRDSCKFCSNPVGQSEEFDSVKMEDGTRRKTRSRGLKVDDVCSGCKSRSHKVGQSKSVLEITAEEKVVHIKRKLRDREETVAKAWRQQQQQQLQPEPVPLPLPLPPLLPLPPSSQQPQQPQLLLDDNTAQLLDLFAPRPYSFLLPQPAVLRDVQWDNPKLPSLVQALKGPLEEYGGVSVSPEGASNVCSISGTQEPVAALSPDVATGLSSAGIPQGGHRAGDAGAWPPAEQDSAVALSFAAFCRLDNSPDDGDRGLETTPRDTDIAFLQFLKGYAEDAHVSSDPGALGPPLMLMGEQHDKDGADGDPLERFASLRDGTRIHWKEYFEELSAPCGLGLHETLKLARLDGVRADASTPSAKGGARKRAATCDGHQQHRKRAAAGLTPFILPRADLCHATEAGARPETVDAQRVTSHTQQASRASSSGDADGLDVLVGLEHMYSQELAV